MNDQTKKPVRRKLFSPKTSLTKGKGKGDRQENEDDLITGNLNSGLEGDFDICNVGFVLPYEYDHVTEVVENENYEEEELAKTSQSVIL